MKFTIHNHTIDINESWARQAGEEAFTAALASAPLWADAENRTDMLHKVWKIINENTNIQEKIVEKSVRRHRNKEVITDNI
jgi:hypothetical protein